MINEPILQDDIIILNGYVCDKRASKYIYQAKVNKFKEIIDNCIVQQLGNSIPFFQQLVEHELNQ